MAGVIFKLHDVIHHSVLIILCKISGTAATAPGFTPIPVYSVQQILTEAIHYARLPC